MTAPGADVARHAARLRDAQARRTPIAPLTENDGSLTLADAYAIQTLNIEARVADGAVLVGRKVGLTSRPMQAMLGVHEPDYGALLSDMAVEDGADVALDGLLQPRVEAEIAFVMAEDLAGPGVTATTAIAAVAGAIPALEIIDSRITDWRISLIDTVADNASSGLFVTAPRLTPLAGLDLRLEGMALSRNGEIVETGTGAAVLGNPLHCLAWLANKLSEFGVSLRAGDVVLAGALHRAMPVAHGDVLRADFATLGTVGARFVGPQGARA